jgi:hypothetical protein
MKTLLALALKGPLRLKAGGTFQGKEGYNTENYEIKAKLQLTTFLKKVRMTPPKTRSTFMMETPVGGFHHKTNNGMLATSVYYKYEVVNQAKYTLILIFNPNYSLQDPHYSRLILDLYHNLAHVISYL